MKNILTNSLFIGTTSIIVFSILHFINPSLNFDFTLTYLIGSVIYLFFLIRAGFQQRKKLGGYLGFGEVFISSIAIYAIGALIGAMFTYIMVEFNPELTPIIQESSKSMNESVLSMSGMSEEQIALIIEEANENTDPEQIYTLSTVFIGWLGSIIFPGLLFALIASLVTKKKDETENVE